MKYNNVRYVMNKEKLYTNKIDIRNTKVDIDSLINNTYFHRIIFELNDVKNIFKDKIIIIMQMKTSDRCLYDDFLDKIFITINDKKITMETKYKLRDYKIIYNLDYKTKNTNAYELYYEYKNIFEEDYDENINNDIKCNTYQTEDSKSFEKIKKFVYKYNINKCLLSFI